MLKFTVADLYERKYTGKITRNEAVAEKEKETKPSIWSILFKRKACRV